MPDLIIGLMEAIAAGGTVNVDSGGRIYESEEGLAENANMPEKVVIVRRQGGPGGPATLKQTVARVELKTYAETPHLASVLHGQVSDVLKQLQSSVWASTYITGCILSSGQIDLRDPVLQWPYTVSSWLVRFADQDAT